MNSKHTCSEQGPETLDPGTFPPIFGVGCILGCICMLKRFQGGGYGHAGPARGAAVLDDDDGLEPDGLLCRGRLESSSDISLRTLGGAVDVAKIISFKKF